MNKLRIVKEAKILTISLLIGLTLALGVAAYTYVYSQAAQQDIAKNVIRFHVSANSNSRADQEIKNIVRDKILTEFEELLSSSENIKESRQLLKSELPAIQAHAEDIVRQLGFDYEIETRIEQVFFPTKVYGDLTFPPGMYEALQISIGDGIGRNWWCLMFPPLCFVDMTATEASQQYLAGTLSDESFRLLTHQHEDAAMTMEVRFRVVEWWQNRRYSNQPGIQPSYAAGN